MVHLTRLLRIDLLDLLLCSRLRIAVEPTVYDDEAGCFEAGSRTGSSV